jgi:hypothetical protein
LNNSQIDTINRLNASINMLLHTGYVIFIEYKLPSIYLLIFVNLFSIITVEIWINVICKCSLSYSKYAFVYTYVILFMCPYDWEGIQIDLSCLL